MRRIVYLFRIATTEDNGEANMGRYAVIIFVLRSWNKGQYQRQPDFMSYATLSLSTLTFQSLLKCIHIVNIVTVW